MQLNVTPVPFLDLSEEFHALEEEWQAAISEIGACGRYILGPNVQAFEKEFAEYNGNQFAISVANGTDALYLSLRALGIGPGDEVITSPFTFFASSEVIDQAGATPVFADIDEHSFCLDSQHVRRNITDRTRAILPVHIFGHPSDMTSIMAIAAEHQLPVIEDCAQAFGASVGDHKVGNIGTVGCYSFYPTKVLGCYGDGGMITSNDESLLEHIGRLKNHGAVAPFMHSEIGMNSRLDEIQAALLRIKLRKADDDIARRRKIAARYTELLADTDVITPSLPDNGAHVFNLYTVKLQSRDAVRQHLTDSQVASSQCYPTPLHLQEVYQHLGYKAGDLPVSEALSSQTLSLPVFPAMTDEQIQRVVAVLKEAL
ncbi:MAG: DegT/DnrJ/EryC1/StrS family aminotransferase [Gammaproteobacteria bacterium]|nr:MAG: DegT/DnrJ/EryC1/StrS family aminotransferase [Gammaproteobacteria bacterium]